MATKSPTNTPSRSVGDFVRLRYGTSKIRLAEVVGPERRYASGQRVVRIRLLSTAPSVEPVEFDVPLEWLEDVSQREESRARRLVREAAAATA